MTMLALTPSEFIPLAVAWATAVLTVISILLPKLVALKTQLDALHERQNRQGERQNTQDQTVAQVALSVLPGATPPANPPQ